jgi:very-short-patch-repair endonuclease
VRGLETNPWSVPESRLHRALEEHGVGGWVANRRLLVAGAAVHPDVAFPKVKLAIEVDGRRYHAEAADPAAFERDARRRKTLTDDGWYVLHFTAQQILTDVDGVVETIMSVIARLSALRAA